MRSTYAGLTGKETVWDLYCGIGTISLFLARKAEAGLWRGNRPAGNRGCDDRMQRSTVSTMLKFYVGKAEEVLPASYERKTRRQIVAPDVIVVDPPRKGCDGVVSQDHA